ncbi:putative dUTPase [Cucurbitaria berberidis CBS 394.84]|uniref:dUTPase n=1 Tax=Cucurbitaria berberidis CBS 394.84 TaxID=1168544 RepID=A0A9P4L802_9PLEO|nr:putative dUTPase [Cucurbitaria berberidis CBS 394.84]KAF1844819.1 putative dUTPase [Cucurbitaria berberidis CBS 394.84]
MIIPGRVALQRQVITHLRSAEHQTQPCGIDLTLKRVMKWSSSGTIDFDNSQRKTAQTIEIPFKPRSNSGNTSLHDVPQQTHDPNVSLSKEYLDISCGSYLVEFNELVDMPLDLMGQILVRSSLFRSGALINAGVMDSGYKGAVGAMLQVVNPHGLRLLRDAKLAQMVFHQMSEPVDGYSGVYQGRSFV